LKVSQSKDALALHVFDWIRQFRTNRRKHETFVVGYSKLLCKRSKMA